MSASNGRTEPTRIRTFLTWAVREAAEGRLDSHAFLRYARSEGLCVSRIDPNGRAVWCTPWDPDYPEKAAPKSRAKAILAPWDRRARHTGRLALELEDEQRRDSWAVAMRADHVVVRAVGVGVWKVPSEELALEVARWRKRHSVRELPNGCLLLFVPLEEWKSTFGQYLEGQC